MITRNTDYSIQRLRGLSTDGKPMNATNGDEFIEMDTGKKFLFSAADATWYEQHSSGGSGGGGSDMVLTPTAFYDDGGIKSFAESFNDIKSAIDAGRFVLVYETIVPTSDMPTVTTLHFVTTIGSITGEDAMYSVQFSPALRHGGMNTTDPDSPLSNETNG